MAQFDFLTTYIEDLLTQVGLGALTDEQKKIYVPQFVSQVEERLGIELLPKLNRDHLAEFADLIERTGVTAEEWKTFWYGAIPNFDEEIKGILLQFAQEVRQIMTV